jgi:ribonucleoside-diphosphate reductase alpha chain
MNKSAIKVVKRDGRLEPFDLEKVHRVLEWSTEGITGVSISEIEIRSNIQLYDGIKASEIHDLLIKSASELISEQTPNYQFVAARLVNYKIRKEVYGQYEPLHLAHCIVENVAEGVYDGAIMQKYTREEVDQLNDIVKHDRDDKFTYVAMEQFRSKYLVQDRSTKRIYDANKTVFFLRIDLFRRYIG